MILGSLGGVHHTGKRADHRSMVFTTTHGETVVGNDRTGTYSSK